MSDSGYVHIDIDINSGAINKRLQQLAHDPKTMLEIHNLLAKMCDPWVPFLEGPLSQTLNITHEYVQYTMPYAHRQYYGDEFNHTLDYHPLASARWDKAMMQVKGREFTRQVKEILVRRARQMYG